MNSFWVTLWKKMSVGERMFVLKCLCMFWDSKEKKNCEKHMKKKTRKEKKERKEKELEKMKEWVIKCWMLKKGSKTPNLALNDLNSPLLFKRWVFIQKWILSWFNCFAHYFFKNLCFPYHFFVSQTPQAPLQPVTSILSVMCFNLWSLNLVWAYGVTSSRI